MQLFATQNIECVGLTDAKNDEQTLHTCQLHETKQKIGLTGKEKELKFLKKIPTNTIINPVGTYHLHHEL